MPIIPDFLLNVDSQLEESKRAYNFTINHYSDIDSENGRVGFLLSSKAIIQMGLNPLVGHWTAVAGYSLPLFTGTSVLLLSTVCAFKPEFPKLFPVDDFRDCKKLHFFK